MARTSSKRPVDIETPRSGDYTRNQTAKKYWPQGTAPAPPVPPASAADGVSSPSTGLKVPQYHLPDIAVSCVRFQPPFPRLLPTRNTTTVDSPSLLPASPCPRFTLVSHFARAGSRLQFAPRASHRFCFYGFHKRTLRKCSAVLQELTVPCLGANKTPERANPNRRKENEKRKKEISVGRGSRARPG